MATTIKALARGSFATSSATLYTVPSATTTIVTNIMVTNTTESEITFTILFDGVEAFDTAPVAAKSTAIIDIKQALSAAKIISGFASSADAKYHLTGAEIA